jgi:hypothetical protein
VGEECPRLGAIFGKTEECLKSRRTLALLSQPEECPGSVSSTGHRAMVSCL